MHVTRTLQMVQQKMREMLDELVDSYFSGQLPEVDAELQAKLVDGSKNLKPDAEEVLTLLEDLEEATYMQLAQVQKSDAYMLMAHLASPTRPHLSSPAPPPPARPRYTSRASSRATPSRPSSARSERTATPSSRRAT